MLLLSGSAHPELANQIANRLQIDLCPTRSFKFKNGETNVEIEWSVRGSDVYVIQFRPKRDFFILSLLKSWYIFLYCKTFLLFFLLTFRLETHFQGKQVQKIHFWDCSHRAVNRFCYKIYIVFFSSSPLSIFSMGSKMHFLHLVF